MKIFTTDDLAAFIDDNSLTKEITNKLLKVYSLLAKNFLNINEKNLEGNLFIWSTNRGNM